MNSTDIFKTFDINNATDRLVMADFLIDEGRDEEAALIRDHAMIVVIDGRVEELTAALRKRSNLDESCRILTLACQPQYHVAKSGVIYMLTGMTDWIGRNWRVDASLTEDGLTDQDEVDKNNQLVDTSGWTYAVTNDYNKDGRPEEEAAGIAQWMKDGSGFLEVRKARDGDRVGTLICVNGMWDEIDDYENYDADDDYVEGEELDDYSNEFDDWRTNLNDYDEDW